MEGKQRKRRRLIRALCGLTVLSGALLGLVPLWFPWVLTPLANRYGLKFADYERMGWTRFALTEVRGAWGGTVLEAQRIESGLPTMWLWRRFAPHTNGPPLLTVGDGRLTIGTAVPNATLAASSQSQVSADETLNQISRIGRRLEHWLPAADLTNVTIQMDSSRVSIPHAAWGAGRLQAVVHIPSAPGEFELVARLDEESGLKFAADWDSYAASLRGGFSRTKAGWRWNGELGWLTNRANFTAQFTANGWWPVQAQVAAREWQIPMGFLPVEGYENLVASLTAKLASNRFDLHVTGLAEPADASARIGWPAVNFSLSAAGDATGVKLNALNIQAPGLSADLTNSVGLSWTGEIQPEPAQLRISVDLEKLPGSALTGKAEGFVRLESQGGRTPAAKFQLAAAQVRAGDWDIKTVLVRGEFVAPVLKLDEFRAEFADGSVVAADGSFNTAARAITGGHWKLSGGLGQKILPGVWYDELVAAGELHGPLTNLTHHGEVAVTHCWIAGLKPGDLQATWSGEQRQLTAVNGEWTAGKTVLSIGANGDLSAPQRGVTGTMTRLALRRSEQELYALQQPCAFSFGRGKPNAPGQFWNLAVDGFDWRHERHSISVNAGLAWPAQGEATLTVTNVSLADFSDLLTADIAKLFIAELAGAAHWSNGPVHALISARASFTNSPGQVFGVHGAVKADGLLSIESLALASGYTPTLSVTGTIPVQIIPEHREGMVVWDPSQSIALVGNWQDDQLEGFSIPLGKWDRLELSRPKLAFRVSGTPEAPAAELTAAATQLTWRSKTNALPRPTLEALQLAVEIRPDAIRLKSFIAQLDGQPITASGEWPYSRETWRGLWSDGKLPDWGQAQASLQLAAAPVAAFSSYLPEVLAPEGHLDATLSLKPGKRLEGILSLTNAATRPMGPITPMRDIAALVRFDGHRAVLQDFRAQIGGQPIRADGFVTIPELDGRGLDYQVNLHGTNVPLARRPELLLRGDFQLSLRGGSSLRPVLSGTVTLRDGLYVEHASALVWSAPRRPEWRPPYFSVTDEPFADWKLELTVRGDRFLRLRTPLFSGVGSANLQLSGSLRTPVLTGDARVNSGRIIFPFGSLTLDQGIASFSGHDPRGPELQINGAGRNYRYEVRLEVKGPADGANVMLSSTPPLTTEQILLMLTAGEVPQSDFSFSNGARAGRLGTFLGTDLLGRYWGSDPAKERLIFRTGESISGSGRLTYSVEYRLTDRWSIIGAYDEFNAFNTDLKWKVFTR